VVGWVTLTYESVGISCVLILLVKIG